MQPGLMHRRTNRGGLRGGEISQSNSDSTTTECLHPLHLLAEKPLDREICSVYADAQLAGDRMIEGPAAATRQHPNAQGRGNTRPRSSATVTQKAALLPILNVEDRESTKCTSAANGLGVENRPLAR